MQESTTAVGRPPPASSRQRLERAERAVDPARERGRAEPVVARPPDALDLDDAELAQDPQVLRGPWPRAADQPPEVVDRERPGSQGLDDRSAGRVAERPCQLAQGGL